MLQVAENVTRRCKSPEDDAEPFPKGPIAFRGVDCGWHDARDPDDRERGLRRTIQSSNEVNRLALAAQQKLVIRSEDLFSLTPPRRLGTFTLVPPETNGKVIRVAIPIGERASRAARAISDARQRRAERRIDERVMRELQELVPDGKDEK
jgi:hypothetical protein